MFSFIKLVKNMALAISLGCIVTNTSLAATNYPERPVTLVIGFTAGGPTDVIGRILAENLSKKLNQTFIVENKPGASGAVAATQVKRAKPDGYTLMLGSSSTLSIIPHIQENTQYDPLEDFTTIALVASYPYFLVVSSESDIHDWDDLIAAGSDENNPLDYASAGVGAVNHLAAEWFSHEAGINAVHIPYNGDSAILNDLSSNRIDFAFLAGAAALPYVKDGSLRLIASASEFEGRGGEDLLNIYHDKLPGFSAEPWNGVMGPAGMDQEIVEKLNKAINEILTDPEVLEKLSGMEQFPFTESPDFFAEHIKTQSARWEDVIKKTGIELN